MITNNDGAFMIGFLIPFIAFLYILLFIVCAIGIRSIDNILIRIWETEKIIKKIKELKK